MAKISFLNDRCVVPKALFAQILEEKGLEAVVCVVRVDGCWYSVWTTDIDNAGISMASVKLLSDVQDRMHDREATWSPPQKDEA